MEASGTMVWLTCRPDRRAGPRVSCVARVATEGKGGRPARVPQPEGAHESLEEEKAPDGTWGEGSEHKRGGRRKEAVRGEADVPEPLGLRFGGEHWRWLGGQAAETQQAGGCTGQGLRHEEREAVEDPSTC